MKLLYRALSWAIVIGASSCATQRGPAYWDASDIAATTYEKMQLQGHELGTIVRTVSVYQVRMLVDVTEAIQSVAGVSARLYLIEGDEPNAFASSDNGNMLAISLGMLDLTGSDREIFAALVGHEIAHIVLRHGQARAERQSAETAGKFILGLILGRAGASPVASQAADMAAGAIGKAYTRDEEREADRIGLELARKAGYDAQGAVRLWEKMVQHRPGATGLAFLSTHPQSDERLETIRRLASEPR